MMTLLDLQQLPDGTGLVDDFGFCYHKEADGIIDHQSDKLLKWVNISIIMLDCLTIVQQTEKLLWGLTSSSPYDII